jgi:pimeloyl-ACP methyl ester carboxylesterase
VTASAPSAAPRSPRPRAAPPLAVEEIGSFHVGGRSVSLRGLPTREVVFTAGAPALLADGTGDFEVEQMYVQYVRLAEPRARYPLLLMHGGGLTGVTYETTPDGRPGWQMFFLRQGHSVYTADAVERGRASGARVPEIWPAEPEFRTKKEACELFSIGTYDADPARRTTHAGQRFPVGAFDQFMKQAVPRWTINDVATQAAYDALVRRIGPCVIVTHSQGGNFAFHAALNAPDMVRAVIAVEPSGAPGPAIDAARVKGVPHLWVWGDNLDTFPFWGSVVPAGVRYRDAIVAAGGCADWLDLPRAGVRGNTHMVMMDDNSDEVAQRLQDWMAAHGLMT